MRPIDMAGKRAKITYEHLPDGASKHTKPWAKTIKKEAPTKDCCLGH